METIKTITLCGSRKFSRTFIEVEYQLTKQGYAVLRPVFFEQLADFEITAAVAELLGRVHLKKIELADEILVIDVNGYIGARTQKEIDYARSQKKVVKMYSDLGI